MKKFIVSENIAHATSRAFKETIDFAVRNTESGRNFRSSSYDIKFVGTVVTFNQSTKEVECFSLNDYIDYSNEEQVLNSLQKKLSRIVGQEEFSSNEFVTFIRASDFEYHGYTGYSSSEEQKMDKMKLEHKAMSIYIDIINAFEEQPVSLVTSIKLKESAPHGGTDIDTLNLSVRTTNCLRRANVNTIEHVKSLSLDEISRIRNLGRNSLNELESVLGITFV